MQYKLLGRSGLKVSELCLGTMGFGTNTPWGVDKLASFSIMEAFGNAGGNFMDTANRYQDGMSEEIVGDFINQRDRDYWVIATKYSLYDNQTNVNASGNNRKNMMRSVEKSLKRLKTDFIDVLYLHIWDWLTPMDEVLRGLDDLVRQGKVTYIAISDTPAWMVSKGQTMAELMGWSQFVALQIEYSLLQRSPERDLIPMARHYGLTVTPWAPLAGGALTGKYLRNDPGRIKPDSKRLNDTAVSITKEVIRIAEELGVKPSQVALAWTMQQGFSSIPIVGATKLTQMEENLGVLNVKLDAKHLEQLDAVSKIDLGFPGEFYKEDGVKLANYGGFYNSIQHRG
jgi:aryl-alcohol dehydrogenase-like predicted oxidoreductase